GFPGFAPLDVSDHHRNNFAAYADAETEISPQVLADVAGRFEHYSDFGSRVTGKLALRYQPSRQLTLRGAACTWLRAPGICQEFYRQLIANWIGGGAGDVPLDPVNERLGRM